MVIVSSFVTNDPSPQRLGGEPILIHKTLDFNATNASANDVIEALKILSGTFVHSVHTRVSTVESDTMTLDAGDGDDPNGYDDAVDGNSAPSNGACSGISTIGTDAYAVGKKYTADDTIDIVLDNDADAMILEVYALISRDESSS